MTSKADPAQPTAVPSTAGPPLPRARAGRTHRERREEAERRMLDAALGIVADGGLPALTLARCGEEAGYSRGLASHYFGSKDGLVRAIVRHIVDDYAQRLRSGWRGGSGLEALVDSIEFYLRSGSGGGPRVRAFHAVVGAAPGDLVLTEAIDELNRTSVRWLAQLLRSGIARGEIRQNIDPEAQATILVGSLRGAVAQWLLAPHRVDLDRIRAELVDSVRRNLGAA